MREILESHAGMSIVDADVVWTKGYYTFSKEFSKRMKAKKFNDTTLHTLRHAFASKLVNSGVVSINVAAEILGHKSIATTMKYVHHGDDAKFEAMNRLAEKSQRDASLGS